MPGSCRPYQQFNRYHLCRWHHRAYRRWGTGRKHLLQQYVSSLSDRKQRWHWRAGTSRRTFIRVKFSRSNRSVSKALTSRNSKRTAGNKTKRKRKYWSTIRSDDDIPFLEREADFFPRKRFPPQEKYSLQQQNCVQLNFLNFLIFMHLLKFLFVSLILTCLYLYVCPWSKFNERKSLPWLALFVQNFEIF